MLTKRQETSHIVASYRSVIKRIRKWWLVMSDQEQRDVVMRGTGVAACAIAVTVAMPVISERHDIQRADADFRNEAIRFAQARDAGSAVRADEEASPLLDHPWLVTVEYALERNPRSALNRYSMLDRDSAAVASVVSFEPRHLAKAETVAAEYLCMSQAVYYEAGSESTSGQLAVGEVITNRVRDHRYPNSVCEVVYQGATRTTGCQFTFTCDGAMDRKPVGRRWAKAQLVASQVMMGLNEERTGEATHYHATYVDPVWNSGLIRTSRIGAHIFYRFPRGAEWASAREAVDRRRAAGKRQPTIVPVSAASTVATSTSLNVLSPAP